MDDEAIVERIRANAEQFNDADTDVDALVDRAVSQGRRRRTRRRIAGAVTGAVAAITAIALLGVLPTGLRSGPRVVPAAPAPQTSTSSPSAAKHTATPTPTAPAPVDRVSGSPAEVKRTLIGLLPDSVTVTHSSSSRDTGSNGFAWENDADLTVRDAQGITYVLGGIGDGSFEDGCMNNLNCTERSTAGGGTLWVISSTPGDKSGNDRTIFYNRPNGGHIWMMERNFATGNGPVTRDHLLLSETAGRKLITDPVWDGLFEG